MPSREEYLRFVAQPNRVNQYGVPMPACHGYRQDEQVWDWMKHKRITTA